MKLLMFLGNDMIDSMPLCPKSITLPGYIGRIKHELEKKYLSLIEQANIEPEFLVVKASQENKPYSAPRKHKR